MTTKAQPILVTVSYPNKPRQCKHFITAILRQKLAKCIHRHNYMKSYYIREGELKKQEEKLLVIKSTADKQEKLLAMIKKLHPYETPEIIVMQPDFVDPNYLERLQS